MKPTMLGLFIVLAVGAAFGQDVTATPYGNFYADSLKTTHDTVDVVVSSMSDVSYFTISAYTDSGVDTVLVYTKAKHNSFYVQHGLVDLAGNGNVTQMFVTTTAKEWAILDTSPGTIRLYSPGTTAIITRFVVAGK